MRATGVDLGALTTKVADALRASYADSTNSVDTSHWRAWVRMTTDLGTTPVRDDVAANTGADPEGYRLELILMDMALLYKYATMSPRSHADPAADPNLTEPWCSCVG